MKKFYTKMQAGFGPVFFISISLAITALFLFSIHFLQKKPSTTPAIAANAWELFFYLILYPVFAWLYQRKNNLRETKNYKILYKLSKNISLYLLKNPSKIIQSNKMNVQDLLLFQNYLSFLADREILRKTPLGENIFQFQANESPIKKYPRRGAFYFRFDKPHPISFFTAPILASYMSLSLAGLNLSFLPTWVLGQISLFSKWLLIIPLPVPLNQATAIILLFSVLVFAGGLFWGEKKLYLFLQKNIDKRREQSLLRYVRKNNGLTNSYLACLTMGIPLHRSKDYLEYMQSQNAMQKMYDEAGLVYYRVIK